MSASSRELTLVSKPDCHLCHEMRDVVERVLPPAGITLVERDVRSDPELERRYRFDIPVLLAGEHEIARHCVTATELRERLAALGFLDPAS